MGKILKFKQVDWRAKGYEDGYEDAEPDPQGRSIPAYREGYAAGANDRWGGGLEVTFVD